MRPRLPIGRIPFLRPLRPPNYPRLFTQNTLLPRSRPHLPFLYPPNRRPASRFISTETKQWLKSEIILSGKYIVLIGVTGALLMVMSWGVAQEYLDREYPPPPEWGWITKQVYRSAMYFQFGGKEEEIFRNWTKIGYIFRKLLEWLEDPTREGAGLVQQGEGGILVEGVGRTGYDITMKSEPWRRGYYEVLIGLARAAENLESAVLDTSRQIIYPGNTVIGPSNPEPRPLPPGAPTPAPREENCQPAFDMPEVYYMRILTTKGFTERQRMEAALGYAVYLDYKQTPDSAQEMYKWALDIATSSLPIDKSIVDPKTGVLNTSAGIPSANILAATTALAVHHASNHNLQQALPIFLSILRARRMLPEAPTTMHSTLIPDEDTETFYKKATGVIKHILIHPPHPPPPNDGTAPPLRDPKERCEEAGIMANIGEILYASKPSKTNREDGLAWTREAVDLAEEELRRKRINQDAKKTCKQCLEVGLVNWQNMVAKMAREERETITEKTGGWLGFGGKEEKKDVVGRWESEERVIKERVRRVNQILMTSSGTGGIAVE